jgi:hypothetical protein
MRSSVVVLLSPPVDHAMRLLDRCEQLAVQATVPQHTIETFVMCVPPWAAWLDDMGRNALLTEPAGDLHGHELSSVGALQAPWGSTL